MGRPEWLIRACVPLGVARGRVSSILRQLIREPQQFDGGVHVFEAFQIPADPAAIWKDMVGFSLTGGQDLVADPAWERDIHQRIAVHVPEFAASDSVFEPTEAVRMCAHPLEPEHRRPDAFAGAVHAHAGRCARCQSQNSCTARWKGIGSGRASSRRDFERSQNKW